MYIFFPFGALYFGQPSCIYSWDVQTLAIVYMTLEVHGQYLRFVYMGLCLWLCVWICVYDYAYGYVFMDRVYDYVYGYVFMDRVYDCVYGYVYGYV